MTELEKLGLLIMFLIAIGTLCWGIMMIHNDLLRISIKQEKLIKLFEWQKDKIIKIGG